MKRITAIIFTLALLFTTAIPAFAAAPEVAVPYYANTSHASVSFVIEDNGAASWTITCLGKSSCTGISAVTYLERQVGLSWVRVDLGNVTSDQYTYTTTDSRIAQNNKTTLTTPGLYRAVVVFTVYGTQENERITLWNEHAFGI